MKIKIKNLLISLFLLSLISLPVQLRAAELEDMEFEDMNEIQVMNDDEDAFWKLVNLCLESGNYLSANNYLYYVMNNYEAFKDYPDLIYKVVDIFLNGPRELNNHYYAHILLKQLADEGYEKAVKSYNNFPFRDDEDFQQQLVQCLADAESGDAEALFMKGIHYLFKGDEFREQGVDCLKKSAEAGNMNAQYTVGMITYRHYHTPGMVWFYKASRQGHIESTVRAIYMAGFGFYDEVPEDSMKWFKYLASQDDVRGIYGMRRLAYCYWTGRCGEQNFDEAIKWYNRLIEKGDTKAMVRMAELYDTGLHVERNPELAIEYYTKAARAGDTDAMLGLGKIRFNNKDYSDALDWLNLAFQSRDRKVSSNAASYIAECYENGYGVEKDLDKALQFYEEANDMDKVHEIKAGKGDSGSQYVYGKSFHDREEYEDAQKWFRMSANGGNHLAMYHLGEMYENGMGVDKDYKEAAAWYKKGADAGNGNAQFALGLCYFNGNGVNKDYAKAFSLFDKARDYENSGAFALDDELEPYHKTMLWKKSQLYLGKCYEEGLGVKQDVNKAIDLYKEGSEFGRMGWEEAELRLGLAYHRIGDYDSAVPIIRGRVVSGDADAQFAMSDCYRLGRGVGVDHYKAYDLLQKSSQQGHKEAKKALEYFPFDTSCNLKQTAEEHKAKAEKGDAVSQCLWGWYCYKTDRKEAAKWFEKSAQAGNAAGQYALGRYYFESDPQKAKNLFLDIITKKELMEDAIKSNVIEAAGNAVDELDSPYQRMELPLR